MRRREPNKSDCVFTFIRLETHLAEKSRYICWTASNNYYKFESVAVLLTATFPNKKRAHDLRSLADCSISLSNNQIYSLRADVRESLDSHLEECILLA